jgi:hypothetical protein
LQLVVVTHDRAEQSDVVHPLWLDLRALGLVVVRWAGGHHAILAVQWQDLDVGLELQVGLLQQAKQLGRQLLAPRSLDHKVQVVGVDHGHLHQSRLGELADDPEQAQREQQRGIWHAHEEASVHVDDVAIGSKHRRAVPGQLVEALPLWEVLLHELPHHAALRRMEGILDIAVHQLQLLLHGLQAVEQGAHGACSQLGAVRDGDGQLLHVEELLHLVPQHGKHARRHQTPEGHSDGDHAGRLVLLLQRAESASLNQSKNPSDNSPLASLLTMRTS